MTGIRCLSNKRGFTLVEALIASLIMAVGLFAAGTAVYTQFTSLNENREKTIAALTAQGEIENIRGMKFSDILPLTSFDVNDAPGLAYLKDAEGKVKVDNSYGPDIKKVSVTVAWNSINGKPLQKTMATLMTNGGINKR